MDFDRALHYMRCGGSVRRPCWREDQYINISKVEYFGEDPAETIAMHNEGKVAGKWSGGVDDILADDWEVLTADDALVSPSAYDRPAIRLEILCWDRSHDGWPLEIAAWLRQKANEVEEFTRETQGSCVYAELWDTCDTVKI